MRKIITIFVTVILALSLSACTPPDSEQNEPMSESEIEPSQTPKNITPSNNNYVMPQ